MRILILVLLALPCFAQSGNLKNRLTPGGIYIGQASSGSKVMFNQRELRISPQGQFIIGFGRDAKLQQTVLIQEPDGTENRIDLVLKPREYRTQSLTGIARKYVTPAKSVLDRIRQEAAMVRQARTIDSDQTDLFNGFSWPVNGRISGVYGSQRIYNGKPGRPHFGLDIAVPTGTSVAAPAEGVVRLAERDLYYSGGTIIIDHGYGLFSSFLHLSQVNVVEGQKIIRGEKIGEVGATGRVTGAHLDWRYNWFDSRLDPELLTIGPNVF